MQLVTAVAVYSLALYLYSYRTGAIIDGRVAIKGQFPYAVKIVSYYFRRTHTNASRVARYICTGSILHEDFVLTSAGCFDRMIHKQENTTTAVLFNKYTPTYLRGGVFDGFSHAEPGFQERRATIMYVHPDYVRRSTMFDVDIALIKVNKPWNFTQDPSQVNRVPHLAQRIKSDDFLKCSVAGFGYLSPEDFVANREDPMSIPEPIFGNILRYYYARVGREGYCKHLRKEFDKQVEHYDDFYACALPMNRTVRQGVCYGDLGCPMVCNGLLTGVYSQYRARRPCEDKLPENTAYAIFTVIGSEEVLPFLRQFVPLLPDFKEVPQSNPWDDYYEP